MTEDEEQPTPEQYKALLSAFAKQERTMKKVAAELRNPPPLIRYGYPCEFCGFDPQGLADALAPREPIAEADAAEKFSQACEERNRS
jgi:hypothetical protein